MKILLGVDDSVYTRRTVEFLRGMTWPAKTRVVILSAIPFTIQAYAGVHVHAAASNDELLDQLTKLHQDIVTSAERELREAGFTTEGRVLMGDPRETLVETARNEGADLLVVGSHGRSGIAKLLMGSVASHVVTHAPCSVLVVRAANRS